MSEMLLQQANIVVETAATEETKRRFSPLRDIVLMAPDLGNHQLPWLKLGKLRHWHGQHLSNYNAAKFTADTGK